MTGLLLAVFLTLFPLALFAVAEVREAWSMPVLRARLYVRALLRLGEDPPDVERIR